MIITRFKKNKVYQLDDVYNYLGIIPNECYHQDDIGESNRTENNSCGEEIKFIKNVTLKIEIKISD